MPYKLKLILTDGGSIVSPVIVPNNPNHDLNHKSIIKQISNTGASIAKKDPAVKNWKLILTPEDNL